MIISTGLFTTLIIAVPFIAYVIYSIGYKKNRNIARYVFLFFAIHLSDFSSEICDISYILG